MLFFSSLQLARRAARYAAAVSRVCVVFRHHTVWNVHTNQVIHPTRSSSRKQHITRRIIADIAYPPMQLDHLTPLPTSAALLALAWGAGLRATTTEDAVSVVRKVVGPWWSPEDAR